MYNKQAKQQMVTVKNNKRPERDSFISVKAQNYSLNLARDSGILPQYNLSFDATPKRFTHLKQRKMFKTSSKN